MRVLYVLLHPILDLIADSFKEGSRVDFKMLAYDSEIRVKDNTDFGIAAKLPLAHTEWGVLPLPVSSGDSPDDLYDLGLGHSFFDLLKLALGPFNGIWS